MKSIIEEFNLLVKDFPEKAQELAKFFLFFKCYESCLEVIFNETSDDETCKRSEDF